MTYLLDTSAVLTHIRREHGADRVQQLFEQEDDSILLCSVTLAELARRLRELGAPPEQAWSRVTGYCEAVSEVVPVDKLVARESDRISLSAAVRLPLVDALIAAAASTRRAVLVHRDAHLRGLSLETVKQLDLDAL